MFNYSSHRRQIPLWQIAPLLLIPSALVAALTLYWDLSLTPFITTFALTCLTMMMMSMRRSVPQPVMRQVTSVAQMRRRD
jgi:hypothetical protein